MSGLDVAGGVFATVSIALQLADTALKLHHFWRSLKDSPSQIREFASDLLVLQRVLFEIHEEEKLLPGPSDALPTHEPLLQCERYLGELQTLADKLKVDISKGRVQRTWKSIKVIFQKEHLDQFRANLESMKSTLILARQSLASMLQARNTNFLSNAMVSIANQHRETTRTMQAMEVKLDQDTRNIVNALRASSNNAIPGIVISALETSLKHYVKDGFKEGFQELEARAKAHIQREKEVAQSSSFEQRHSKTNCGPFVNETPSKPEFEENISTGVKAATCAEKTMPTRLRKECLEHVGIRKEIETVFGPIILSLTGLFKFSAGDEQMTTESPSEFSYKASIVFKPSAWFARPAMWRIALQMSKTKNGLALNVSPTYNPRIPFTSPIFEACRVGNTEIVTYLLSTKETSVSTVDEWGRGLMHMAAKSQSTRLIELLISEGCTNNLIDDFGNSPLDMLPLFDARSNSAGQAQVIPVDGILDAVRLLVERADCDPNFEHFENRCSNNLLQNLCKYRRVLDLPQLTPIIHYLLTQETFSMEPSPSLALQPRTFNPAPDMVYHTEAEATANMMDLIKRQRISATFVAEFGYSTMQDALMQDHSVTVIRSLIQAGSWLHTKSADFQTPTRIAWWRANIGHGCMPFALYKNSTPPGDAYQIYDFLSLGGNFATALADCGIDLWEFAQNEATVLISDDRDEPLQYLTCACYHRQSVGFTRPAMVTSISEPYRRRSYNSENE